MCSPPWCAFNDADVTFMAYCKLTYKIGLVTAVNSSKLHQNRDHRGEKFTRFSCSQHDAQCEGSYFYLTSHYFSASSVFFVFLYRMCCVGNKTDSDVMSWLLSDSASKHHQTSLYWIEKADVQIMMSSRDERRSKWLPVFFHFCSLFCVCVCVCVCVLREGWSAA